MAENGRAANFFRTRAYRQTQHSSGISSPNTGAVKLATIIADIADVPLRTYGRDVHTAYYTSRRQHTSVKCVGDAVSRCAGVLRLYGRHAAASMTMGDTTCRRLMRRMQEVGKMIAAPGTFSSAERPTPDFRRTAGRREMIAFS